MNKIKIEGIEDLLQTLREKGVRIAMVTGKGKYSTAISLKQFGFENYFEFIETGMPSGPRKPAGIQLVLDHFSNLVITFSKINIDCNVIVKL